MCEFEEHAQIKDTSRLRNPSMKAFVVENGGFIFQHIY